MLPHAPSTTTLAQLSQWTERRFGGGCVTALGPSAVLLTGEPGNERPAPLVAVASDEADRLFPVWAAAYERAAASCSTLAPLEDGGYARDEPFVWAAFRAEGFEGLAKASRRLRWIDPDFVAQVLHDAAEALGALADHGLAHGAVSVSTLALGSTAEGVRALLAAAVPMVPLAATAGWSGDVEALCRVAAHAISGDDLQWLVLDGARPDPPPIQRVAPWIPYELAWVLDGVLRSRPDARLPTARELAHALRVALPWLGRTPRRPVALRSVSVGQRAVAAERMADANDWDAVERFLGDRTERAEPAPTSSDALFAPGDVIGSHYRVTRLLGRGGMGEVYEARDVANGEDVAVKWMRDALPAEKGDLYRRFLREGRLGVSLRSPHLVRVLDVSTDRAAPYIVMELVRGSDVGRLLEASGSLAPAPAARLFVEACVGLEALHEAGLVHRDVKPANLLLDEAADGTMRVRVGDFGIAKRFRRAEGGTASAELTETGGIIGSPHFMAPEQIRTPESVDARTDLFSLGTSLYRALSGRSPWGDAPAATELFLRICMEEPAPLGEVAPWLDAGLVAVVHRSLAKAPEDRYASARELAAALEPFATHEPLRRESLVGGLEERVPVSVAVPRVGASLFDNGTPQRPSTTRVEGSQGRRRQRGLFVFALLASSLAVVATARLFASRGNEPSEPLPPSAPTVITPPEPRVVEPAPTLAPLPTAPKPSATSSAAAPPNALRGASASPRSRPSAAPSTPAPAPSIPPLRQVW